MGGGGDNFKNFYRGSNYYFYYRNITTRFGRYYRREEKIGVKLCTELLIRYEVGFTEKGSSVPVRNVEDEAYRLIVEVQKRSKGG